MKDQTLPTQHECQVLHVGVMDEINGLLSGDKVVPEHLTGRQVGRIRVFVRDIFNHPGDASAQHCQDLKVAQWSKEAVDSNIKEVHEKIRVDKEARSQQMSEVLNKKEELWWFNEKQAKREANANEQFQKAEKWGAAKSRLFSRRQKFLAVLSKEAALKEKMEREGATKYAAKERKSKQVLAGPFNALQKEIASKTSAQAAKQQKENKLKSEKSDKHRMRMVQLKKAARVQHTREVARKKDDRIQKQEVKGKLQKVQQRHNQQELDQAAGLREESEESEERRSVLADEAEEAFLLAKQEAKEAGVKNKRKKQAFIKKVQKQKTKMTREIDHLKDELGYATAIATLGTESGKPSATVHYWQQKMADLLGSPSDTLGDEVQDLGATHVASSD